MMGNILPKESGINLFRSLRDKNKDKGSGQNNMPSTNIRNRPQHLLSGNKQTGKKF